MSEIVDVFVCGNCRGEDSSFVPVFKKDKTVVTCRHCGEVVNNNIVQMEFGPCMTMQEYMELVEYIKQNHSITTGGKRIKYMNMTLDFRTGDIHYVRLGNKEFAKVNENRHRNLKDWVYSYLNS